MNGGLLSRFVVLTLVAVSGCALHTRTEPLKVGDVAPDFALPGADGKDYKLATLLADGPAVVLFYRGYW